MAKLRVSETTSHTINSVGAVGAVGTPHMMSQSLSLHVGVLPRYMETKIGNTNMVRPKGTIKEYQSPQISTGHILSSKILIIR